MQYIVGPIAAIIKWTFDNLLVPIGNLPNLVNPNTIFIVIGMAGLGYWLFWQGKYNAKSRKEGGLK